MKELTAAQQDALVELLNAGLRSAGVALSQLTGHQMVLEVPAVSVHSISELPPALCALAGNDVTAVHQVFSGAVAGDALLLLDHHAAGMLKQLLTGEAPLPLSLDASARELFTDVGNFLLNACLGTFGNLLKVQVSFSLPHITHDSLHRVLETLPVDSDGRRCALVLPAAFKLRGAKVCGLIVIVLGVTALDRLVRAVDASQHRVQ